MPCKLARPTYALYSSKPSQASFYNFNQFVPAAALVCYGKIEKLPQNLVGNLGRRRPFDNVAYRAAKSSHSLLVCGLAKDPSVSLT